MTGRARKPGEGRSSQPHKQTSARRLDSANRGHRSPSPIRAASQRPHKRARYVSSESSSSEEPESSSDSHRPRRPHKRTRYVDSESSLSEEPESSSDSHRPRHKSHSSQSKSRHHSRSHHSRSHHSRSSHSRARHSRPPHRSESRRRISKRTTRRATTSSDDDRQDSERPDPLSSIRSILDKEEERTSKIMKACTDWIKLHKPSVSKERFMELIPNIYLDDTFTQDDYDEVGRQWDAEPTKALILGKHTVDHVTVPGRTPPKYPRRAERESFEIIYRLFPRFYDCTFEEFMSPKYQLELDCSENSRVTLEDGAQVHDPFPSKGFSENMRCLMTQNVWMGNLDLLATCIQYVNILRTRDIRPWRLVNCDPSSKFFETWQDVIKSAHHEQSIQDIFSQVKDLLDQKPGFYGAFFEQIGESVRINCQDRVAYNSKRTHDDDPYFIRVIDLTILIHALDNVGFWGMPFFRGASLSSGIIQQAKRGNDYPPDKKFSKAREYSVLSHRIVKRAAELEAAAQSGASES